MNVTATKIVLIFALVLISSICFNDNYAFAAITAARYIEVLVTTDPVLGLQPTKLPVIESKIWCMLSCTINTCYKLSWSSEKGACSLFDNHGAVFPTDVNTVFYKKEVGNNYKFSKTQNMWYKIHKTMALPNVAYTACQLEGGRIIYVDNLSRHTFLIDILRGETGMYMIDGFDPDDDKIWNHSDGKELSFTYFNSTNEPSDYGGDDCLGVMGADGFSWHDMRCTFILSGFVCEVPV